MVIKKDFRSYYGGQKCQKQDMVHCGHETQARVDDLLYNKESEDSNSRPNAIENMAVWMIVALIVRFE